MKTTKPELPAELPSRLMFPLTSTTEVRVIVGTVDVWSLLTETFAKTDFSLVVEEDAQTVYVPGSRFENANKPLESVVVMATTVLEDSPFIAFCI